MNVTVNFRGVNLDQVGQAWDAQDLSAFTPKNAEAEFDIKDGLQKSDKELVLAAITRQDIELLDRASGAKFSEPFNLQNEEMLIWLFQNAVKVSVEEEDFFLNNAVTGIPLELWVRLFQELQPQVMETMKARCKKTGYSFEQFRAYLLGIKSVVKYCLDNHADLIAFYDGGTSGIMRDRAMRIYKRAVPDKEPVTV